MTKNDEGLLALGYKIVFIPARVVFNVLVTASAWLVISVMTIVARAMQGVQWAVSSVRKSKEKKEREKFEGDIVCTHCFNKIDMPAFKCPGCGALHRDLTPGRLGINERICQCGAILPVGLMNASKELEASCPHCEVTLPQGVGTRRLVTIPVFGPVSSGKTWFLSSLTRHLSDPTLGNEVVPLDQGSEARMVEWQNRAQSGQGPDKTPEQQQDGIAIHLNPGKDNEMEIHLMDSAGENFFDAEQTKRLLYFDHTRVLALVIDPLSIDDVKMGLNKDQIAEHKPADQTSNGSYGAVVDRLRDGGMDVGDKRLAVIVTKADVINSSSQFDPISSNSDEIKDWLIRNGADDLIRRIDLDFDSVKYFAVDSRPRSEMNGQFDPLRVLQWAAGASSDPAEEKEKEHV